MEPIWRPRRPLHVTRPLLVALVLVGLATSCEGSEVVVDGLPPSPSSATGTGTGPPNASPEVEVIDYSSFVAGLEAAGFTASPRKPHPYIEAFTVPARGVFIDGVEVFTFEYPTARAFEKLRSSIRRDGAEVAGTMIHWSEPPRYYGAGRLLVLYHGGTQRTIDALDLVLGPSFAGG